MGRQPAGSRAATGKENLELTRLATLLLAWAAWAGAIFRSGSRVAPGRVSRVLPVRSSLFRLVSAYDGGALGLRELTHVDASQRKKSEAEYIMPQGRPRLHCVSMSELYHL